MVVQELGADLPLVVRLGITRKIKSIPTSGGSIPIIQSVTTVQTLNYFPFILVQGCLNPSEGRNHALVAEAFSLIKGAEVINKAEMTFKHCFLVQTRDAKSRSASRTAFALQSAVFCAVFERSESRLDLCLSFCAHLVWAISPANDAPFVYGAHYVLHVLWLPQAASASAGPCPSTPGATSSGLTGSAPDPSRSTSSWGESLHSGKYRMESDQGRAISSRI